ncbi:Uncharacterised protein [Salmonella bongori]|nr:Uncharacterised protein [Salmonella bongori]
MGDILIISPNIALTKQDLEGYGFIVGEHDGVSSVVIIWIRMPRWVAGLYLDGSDFGSFAGAPHILSY